MEDNLLAMMMLWTLMYPHRHNICVRLYAHVGYEVPVSGGHAMHLVWQPGARGRG